MDIRLNNGKMNLKLRENTTVADALRLLELTLCRELKRPLTVKLNGKMLTEGACKFQKAGDGDAMEITESVLSSNVTERRCLVRSKSLTRCDMTRSALLRRNLLRNDIVDEYRRRITGASSLSHGKGGMENAR